MQTDLREICDFLENRPLPPTPHFDSASIEAAKPVQPLRKIRLTKAPRVLLRFSTAVFAVLMVVVLGIGAMARLHEHSDVPSTTTPSDSEPAVATDSSPDEPEANDSASVTLPKKVNPVRRHRHRYFQTAPEMFEIDDQSLFGRQRPRLVTVIQ